MSSDIEQQFSVLNPWFDNMKYDWEPLVKNGEKVTYKKNEIILRQNEIGHYLYIITRGRVRNFLISPNGEEKALSIMGKNGILGESALNVDARYATNSITASDAELIKITKNKFIDEIGKHPQLSQQILDLMAKKYRLLCMQTMQLSYTKSLPRICATFVHLSIKYGEKLDNEKVKITINFTHQEMANLLGITRVTIAKNIKWLEQNSYIKKVDRYYVIKNLDNLANLANAELMLD